MSEAAPLECRHVLCFPHPSLWESLGCLGHILALGPLHTLHDSVVQNAAARLLSGARKYHHISPILAVLHWLPIQFLVDFKVLMLTYKALNGLGPRYLVERLLPPSSTRVTCASQEVRLRSLTPREAQKEKTRNRAFSAVAPCLWNNLPPEIRAAPLLWCN